MTPYEQTRTEVPQAPILAEAVDDGERIVVRQRLRLDGEIDEMRDMVAYANSYLDERAGDRFAMELTTHHGTKGIVSAESLLRIVGEYANQQIDLLSVEYSDLFRTPLGQLENLALEALASADAARSRINEYRGDVWPASSNVATIFSVTADLNYGVRTSLHNHVHSMKGDG